MSYLKIFASQRSQNTKHNLEQISLRAYFLCVHKSLRLAGTAKISWKKKCDDIIIIIIFYLPHNDSVYKEQMEKLVLRDQL